jgi:hypothetical protein
MDDREPVSCNERPGGLLEPDVVLPAQFFRVLRGREAHGGERRLIIAVLEDAIHCYQKNLFATDNRGRRLFRDAETWVMSVDRNLPFAFENICEFLALDANYLRQGLRRWVRAVASKPGGRPEAQGGTHRSVTTPAAAAAARQGMAATVSRPRKSFDRHLRSGVAH